MDVGLENNGVERRILSPLFSSIIDVKRQKGMLVRKHTNQFLEINVKEKHHRISLSSGLGIRFMVLDPLCSSVCLRSTDMRIQ